MIKPTILLLLVFGVSGYSLLNHYHKTHFPLHRSNGYHTFFKSTSVGLFAFLISAFIFLLISEVATLCDINVDLGHWFLTEVLLFSHVEKHWVAIVDISTITFFMSIVLPWLIYKLFDREHLLEDEFLKDADSPEFSRLFHRSNKTGLPILFTMSDRKVYIGYIYEIQAKIQSNDIYILPVMAGYRDKDNLKFIEVTPYESVIKNIEKEKKLELLDNLNSLALDEVSRDKLLEYSSVLYEAWDKFLVALPLREITYAHLHDLSHEQNFKLGEEALRTSVKTQ